MSYLITIRAAGGNHTYPPTTDPTALLASLSEGEPMGVTVMRVE